MSTDDYRSTVADDEARTEPIAVSRPAAVSAGAGIPIPTVLAAGGLAAVVSALILVTGLVAVMVGGGVGQRNAGAAPSTVVNLGAAHTTAPPAAAPAAPPVGTDPPGSGTPAAGTPAPVAAAPVAPAPVAAAPVAAPAGTGPTSMTTEQLNSQFALLTGNASTAQKGAVLEGGTRAAAPISSALRLVKQYQYTGFTYAIVGPVRQDGTTTSARLQMTLPGSGSRYAPLSWVWKDGAWKLSNKSVCDIASYAQQPCNL